MATLVRGTLFKHLWLLCVTIISSGDSSNNKLFDENQLRNKIESGKQQLQLLLLNDDESDPLCWSQNLVDLMDKQCGSLNYGSRSKIAMKLAVCHLKQSGIDLMNDIECDFDKQCLQQISSNDVAFSTYNQFFTHIDNICIYVQMRDHDKNMKQSMYDLYAATIQSADYLRENQEKQQEFQQQIFEQQTEINQANEEILTFHHQHKENIGNLESIATNIQHQQSDIFAKQKEFETKQNELLDTVTTIDMKQENVLENQDKIKSNLDSLDVNIKSSLSLQEESIERQNNILSKQDDTLNSMSILESKTNELQKEATIIQHEMNKMYESQKMEINNAKEEIHKLTEQSHNAYQQIVGMIDEVLFIVNSIYKLDISMLQQFISIQSVTFYLFWCVVSYITTIPSSARSARIYMFIGILLCVLLEKSIFWLIPIYIVEDVDEMNKYNVMLRKVMFAFNVAIYLRFLLTYRDPAKEQMKLLQKINTNIQSGPRSRSKRIWWKTALKSITPTNLRGSGLRFAW